MNKSMSNKMQNMQNNLMSNSQNDLDFDVDNNDNKYVCGCGKVYGSYPAYSTHRKSKHNNQTVQGSRVPKNQDPKRGRPSYQFKKLPPLQLTQKQYYSGLTTIQLGLLNLQDLYSGKILRSHQQDYKLQIPQEILEKVEEEKVMVQLIKFIELITVHMQDQAALHLVQFLKKLIKFGLDNNCLNEKVFNQYFISQQNKQKKQEQQRKRDLDDDNDKDYDEKIEKKFNFNNQAAKQAAQTKKNNKTMNSSYSLSFSDLSLKKSSNYKSNQNKNSEQNQIKNFQNSFDQKFYIQICLILSEWMNKIGVWSNVIRRRQQE